MKYDLVNYDFNVNFLFHKIVNTDMKALLTCIYQPILLLRQMPVHDV